MIYYVNQAMLHDGDGSLGTPFRRISEAAKIASPVTKCWCFLACTANMSIRNAAARKMRPFSIAPSSRWAR